MKRILGCLLSFILCFSVASCKCNKNEPIVLEDAQYGEKGKMVYLENYDLVKEKIDNKVNFALYIYASGCLSCAAFSPYINSYIEENKIVMYALDFFTFKENNPEIGKLLRTPSVLIFNEGELYEYIAIHIEEHASYFESKDGFGEWFESYVVLK